MSQLTEQPVNCAHAGQPFGVALALMGVHQSGELVARHFVKQLTEQTGALYHAIALRCVMCGLNQGLCHLILPRARRASFNFLEGYLGQQCFGIVI